MSLHAGMYGQYIFMFVLSQGARVWIPDDTDVWASGEVCHDLDGSLLSIQIDNGEVVFYAFIQL